MREIYSTKYIKYTRGKLVVDFKSMAHDSAVIDTMSYRQAQYREFFRCL